MYVPGSLPLTSRVFEYEAVEAFVRTSGPVLSSGKPSLIHSTLCTGPPDEVHVRENAMLAEFWGDIDVSWNEFVSGTILASIINMKYK